EADRSARVEVEDLDDVDAGLFADHVARHVRYRALLQAAARVLAARVRAEHLEAGRLEHQDVVRVRLHVDRRGRLVAGVGESVPEETTGDVPVEVAVDDLVGLDRDRLVADGVVGQRCGGRDRRGRGAGCGRGDNAG